MSGDAPRGTISGSQLEPDWPAVYARLALYLELVLRWNTRTNLTSIRDPEQIVRRHFGESIFAGLALTGRSLLRADTTLLDFGSGAGFPGLPIQILYPELHVTLAESQGKKAAFLREAVRTLELQTEVWADRVEKMPSDRRFEVVTLRAVDDMERSVVEAARRASRCLAVLTTSVVSPEALLDGFQTESIATPATQEGILLLACR